MKHLILLQNAQSGALMQPFFLIAIFAVVYFFFIRPQNKKQKLQEKFTEELAKGKEVVTTGGIIGKISNIDGNIITLAVDNKAQIKILRSSISLEYTNSISRKEVEK